MNQEKQDQQKQPEPKRKRSLIKKIFIGLGVFVLVVICAIGGFGAWVCQFASGQDWLRQTLNSFLEGKAGEPGYKITALSGSLPFNIYFGIEASDKNGIWLKAPQNHFQLEWQELPGLLHISALQILDADLSRFPEFPPDATPKEPAKPFTIADLQNLLAQTCEFLNTKHWWMPDVKISGVEIKKFNLPQDLLPNNQPQLNAGLETDFIDQNLNLNLKTNLVNASQSPLTLEQISLTQLGAELNFVATPAPEKLNAKTDIAINIAKPALNIAQLPENFLGEETALTLSIEAAANTSKIQPALQVSYTGPNLTIPSAKISGNGSWQSGAAWKEGEIDGPLELALDATMQPINDLPTDSPLAMLKGSVNLNLLAKGDLPKIALNLQSDIQKVIYEKYDVQDLQLKIASSEIDVPLNAAALKTLENENQIQIDLSTLLNKEKVNLTAETFFQALKTNSAEKANLSEHDWRTGLRNLQLHALGLECAGEIAALLLAGSEPALDGNLNITVNNWEKINQLLPDQKLSGNVKIALGLTSGVNNNPGQKIPADVSELQFNALNQKINLDLSSSQFALVSSKSEQVRLNALKLVAEVDDPFKDLSFKTNLDAGKIIAAGLNLSAGVTANGALKGPIQAAVHTKGDVNSQINAEWKPGAAKIQNLNIQMNASKLLASKNQKNSILGLKLAGPAEVGYGDHGISIKNVDLSILPSGRLKANGALAPDKLDFKLNLDNLTFKPWQSLVPQIPTGSANISANLTGSPARPQGNFRLGIADLKIPDSNLAPVSLALQGAINNAGNASSLNLHLTLDPKTLKTLGGTQANVSAKIPLLFNNNGVPAPNMQGPLQAVIRWDGALGPLWNLVPVADQRLNGRVGININAGGTLNAPKIRGGVNIDKGRYENVQFGVLLTDINLRVDLLEDGTTQQMKKDISGLPGGVKLALNLTDGRGGTVSVDGKSSLSGENLNIKAKINRLKPLRRRDIHVELSGNADVTGSAMAPDIKGEIIINKGEILLNNLDLASSSVTTLPITDPAKQAKEKHSEAKSGAGVGHLDVRIIMPPRFSVEGRGLGSIWQANLLISGPINDPRVTGTVNCYSGNFDFLGKNFALTKGIVTFAGGSLANPLLNIELTNETPDLTAHINITGPVNKMRLSLSSDPSLPRDDILSRVLFGKSINELGRLEALQLAGAVAQLMGFGSGGGLLSSAKKALGVDVLRIGTSSTNADGDEESGAGGTNIEMGKYINDMLYMGVQQGLQQDSTAFIIQLELTPRTSLEIRTEDNNTWGGLNWKYNY